MLNLKRKPYDAPGANLKQGHFYTTLLHNNTSYDVSVSSWESYTAIVSDQCRQFTCKTPQKMSVSRDTITGRKEENYMKDFTASNNIS
jgi:hypothetical protein